MSERGLCWCGLGREMHDGREVDANGDMHRFNEPVRRPRESGPFEDPAPRAALPPVSAPTLKVLKDAKRFLDNSVLKAAQNGFKFPPYCVSRATELYEQVGKVISELEAQEASQREARP